MPGVKLLETCRSTARSRESFVQQPHSWNTEVQLPGAEPSYDLRNHSVRGLRPGGGAAPAARAAWTVPGPRSGRAGMTRQVTGRSSRSVDSRWRRPPEGVAPAPFYSASTDPAGEGTYPCEVL